MNMIIFEERTRHQPRPQEGSQLRTSAKLDRGTVGSVACDLFSDPEGGAEEADATQSARIAGNFEMMRSAMRGRVATSLSALNDDPSGAA